MPKELLLVEKYDLALKEYDEHPLGLKEVRARALISAISHGTELNLYRGTSPFHEKRFDVEKRLFVAANTEQAYPTRLGYEWVGEVTAVGAEVSDYQVGDKVHLPKPHRETHTFIPEEMAALGVSGPLPNGIAPEQAIFLSTISIALQAVHDAQIKVGDHVVVFGLGVLGLLSVQLARQNGASRIDGVDPIATRRKMAEAMGASRTFDPLDTDIGAAVKANTYGADVAVEFSGSYAALHQAVRSVRMAGLVVAAGFYQGGAAALNLGEEWHHNRVSMVASTRSWGNPHRSYPLWSRARLSETAVDLLKNNHLQLEGLLTHKIPFEQAQQAYALIDNEPQNALKVALTYS